MTSRIRKLAVKRASAISQCIALDAAGIDERGTSAQLGALD
jgi:hypothetical protein